MQTTPSASYSLTLRVRLSSRAGTLGQLATAIGLAGGDIGAIDIVSVGGDSIIRDITVNTASSEHGETIVTAVKGIDGIEVVNVSDRTFESLSVQLKQQVESHALEIINRTWAGKDFRAANLRMRGCVRQVVQIGGQGLRLRLPS